MLDRRRDDNEHEELEPRTAPLDDAEANPRGWDKPRVTDRARAAIRASIDEMSKTPGSGVAMCHAQGKTTVFLSADGKYIVEHTPDGPIIRKPLRGSAEPVHREIRGIGR